jgi:hypothetical protein
MTEPAKQIDWPVLAHVRIAMHELMACQEQSLMGEPACLASLMDAQERIDLAITCTLQRARDTAEE